MIRSLLRKERMEHLTSVVVLWVVLLVGFGLATAVLGRSSDITNAPLRALMLLDLFAVPLSAFWMAGGLVSREYRGHTQFFLETLPVSRLAVLGVKAAVGAVALCLPVLTCGVLALLLTLRAQSVSPLFATIVLVRLFAFAWIWWGVAYFFGFLGRYRFVIAFLAMLAVMLLPEQLGYSMRDVPIIGVMVQIGLERDAMPWAAVLQCLGIGVVAIVAGMGMATVREGSLAAMLAEQMSHRERVGVAIGAVATIVAIIAIGERTRDPHHLNVAHVQEAEGVSLEVAGEGPVTLELSRRLLQALVGARQFLEIDAFPPVFVSRRVDLEPDEFTRGELEDELGAVLQANLGHEDLVEADLVAHLVAMGVGASARGRLGREDASWVLVGFSAWWAAGRPTLREDARYTRRALAALPDGPDARTLGAWFTTREQLGDELAIGVAFSAVAALAEAKGEEATQAWLRDVLGSEVGPLSPLTERLDPVSSRTRKHLGSTPEQLVSTWGAALDAVRPAHPDLAGYQRLEGEVEVLAPSSDTRRVAYRLTRTAGVADRVRFEYVQLPRFDLQITGERHDELPMGRAVSGEQLPGSYPRGTRFAYAFSTWDDRLGCRVSSGWRRMELR